MLLAGGKRSSSKGYEVVGYEVVGYEVVGYEVVGYIQVYFTGKVQETINLASNNWSINIYTNLIWVNKEWNKIIWSPGFFRLRVICAAPHYINWTSGWLRSWLKGGIENYDTSVKDTI